MNNILNIGIFGYGTVGEGLAHVLKNSEGIKSQIKKVCVRTKNKERNGIPQSIITYNADDILKNKDIDLVAELIDDDNEAYRIVKQALINKKNVVSANKKMLAQHLQELIKLQKKHEVSLIYEASSCGSIPIIRNLEEYYDNDLIQSLSGIMNGSSNYILSKIFNENTEYSKALKDAQKLGFAETDPSSDVEGYDTLYKLIILTVHAFGVFIKSDEVFNTGISNLKAYDIKIAKQKGFKIRLIGQSTKLDDSKINLHVCPKFVDSKDQSYNVEDHYNGISINGKFYDNQFMYGKGAGAHPTGSAVLSDISALEYNYKYEYKKLNLNSNLEHSNNLRLHIYISFTNFDQIKNFNFIEINEQFKSSEHNYIIGKINLTELIKHKHIIEKEKLFIATI
ncbi:MAG: homoserine dehydrogenase [Marinifilaceae bacterium]|jgi:homoserine dehydrogenase|nr:homoserine dehydrogenase [Marinifilaceae bacterium]